MSDSNDSSSVDESKKTGTISNLSVRDRMNLWKNRESETQAKSPINPASSKKAEDGHHTTTSSLAKFQNKSAFGHESSPQLYLDSSHLSEKVGSSDTKVSESETKLKSATISSGSILSPLRSALASPVVEKAPVKPAVPSAAASSSSTVAKAPLVNTAVSSSTVSANNSNKSNPTGSTIASSLSPNPAAASSATTTTSTNHSTPPAVVKKSAVPATKIKVEVPADSHDPKVATAAGTVVSSPSQVAVVVSKPPSSPVKKISAKIPPTAASSSVIDDELNKLNAQVANLQLAEKSSSTDEKATSSSAAPISRSNNNYNVSLDERTKDALAQIAKYESATASGNVSTTAIIQDLNTSLKLLKQSLTIASSSSSSSSSSLQSTPFNRNSNTAAVALESVNRNATLDFGITGWSVREAELKANNKKEVESLESQLSAAKQKIIMLEQQQQQVHRNVASTTADSNVVNNDSPSRNHKQTPVDSQNDNSSSSINKNNSSPQSKSCTQQQQQQMSREPPVHVIIDEEDGKLRIMISKNRKRIMTQEYKV